MRVGIVMDSACDLPRGYIDAHHLEMLPIALKLGEKTLFDTRDPVQTIEFYRRYAAEKDIDAETEPFSVKQITDLFLNKLVLKYDRVLVITMSSTRSETFNHANEASFAILNGYKEKRDKAGLEGSFALRVLDSKTLFTGEAVLVHEAVRLLEEEQMQLEKLRPAIEDLSKHVHAYLVPNDLYYVRARARKRGDRSVSWLSYTLGSALDIKPILKAYRGETFPVKKIQGFNTALVGLFDMTEKAIEAGLLTKTICMSYAGNPEEILHNTEYKLFARFAEKHGIELMLSVMSTSAGINVGPGAFSLAYVSDKEIDES
ncbi:MAG: DegV family protein [Gammaproteobacteria bacterium]|nr:DegV family protein [Gammaproteobacteria bacterium]